MPIRLGAALVAATGLLLGPLALAASAAATPHATTPAMGTYVPVAPFRITDTRPNSGQPNAGKTLAAAATLNVQVTGLGTVPAGASAAVLNVTAVDPTVAGFLTVFPAGIAMPTVSNLNFTPGVIVANLVTVPLSTAGMVSIFNHAGNTNVVVDVDGYYTSTPSTNGTGLYDSMSPVRALGNLQLGAPVAANTSVPVTVNGAITGVPASATAVVVNVTAAHGTSASYLTVYPAGAATVPTAASVIFIAGQAIANRVTVGVGTNGQIEVYNHTGTVNVDVDVDGYYSGVGGTGSAFVPITPVRITDTRGTTPVNGTPIAANTSESFNLATTLSTVPATATSVAANVTAVAGNARGYLTVYPTSAAAHPVASDVNWVAKEIVPNFTIADTAGTGSVEVYNAAGAAVNLLIDVFGYFATTSNGPIMESAVVSSSSIAITYNEDVICPAAAAGTLFTYVWTGIATDTINGCTAGGAGSDLLTLTSSGSINPPGTGASLTYTAPAGGNTPTTALYATGSNPDLYAATQTLPFTAFTTPAITAATVNAVAGTIAVSYSELPMGCPANPAVQAVFKYSNGGTPAYPSTCATSGTGVTLGAFMTTATGTTAATLLLPGATDNLVYTSPATPLATNTVYATLDFPQFPAAQTFALTATPAPAMALPVVVTATTVAITYTEGVACPATGADGDFVYDSAFNTLGGAITSCSAVGDVLTLGGIFNTPSGAASIVYTAPATSTTANAVYAAGTTSVFAATQTLFPL